MRLCPHCLTHTQRQVVNKHTNKQTKIYFILVKAESGFNLRADTEQRICRRVFREDLELSEQNLDEMVNAGAG